MREKGRGMTGTYENGIYREGDVRLSDLSGRRRLPIGRDGFAAAVQESVIIDKSLPPSPCSAARAASASR